VLGDDRDRPGRRETAAALSVPVAKLKQPSRLNPAHATDG